MLLKQKPVFGYMGSVDAQLMNAKTLEHLVGPVKTCVETKMLAAKRYDLIANIRLIIQSADFDVTAGYNSICKLVNTIWLDNPHFLEDPNLYVNIIRDIGKVFYEPTYLREHAEDLIYNQNDAIAFLPISEHLYPYESIIDSDKNGFMNAFHSMIAVASDVSTLDFDADLVHDGASLITFGDLKNISASREHVDVIRTIMNKPEILTKFHESDNGDIYSEASMSALHSGLTALYDIWYNTSTLGKDILCEIYKLNIEIHKDDMLISVVSKLQDGIRHSTSYSEIYDDLGLLAKNMMIECKKFSSLRFINSSDLEKKIDIFMQQLFIQVSAFRKIDESEIDEKKYYGVCFELFRSIVENIPSLSHLYEILEKQFQDKICSKPTPYQFTNKLSYMDVLLGIYDVPEEDFDDAVTEASNAIKADGTARVSDANMKKDARPRASNGRYQAKTKDIRSIGLSIGNAFKTFNDHRKDIEKSVDKGWNALKDIFFGTKEVKTAVIEGKRFSITGLLKKLIALPAVFAFGPLQGGLLLIIRAIGRGKIRKEERRKMELAIKEELVLLEEKIQDASSDGDRKAKYAMMRSKAQLENALQRIKYGYEADESPAVKQLMSSEG